ncbi:hypothetical protein BDZ89DRAFT_430047 [Hymenopellis radicata]|nr:hypothetical protein BDZ89DRAFT_430047 [Hymenopellis radicata]
MIRSDAFTDDAVAMSRLILGSRVMLCTLSMLSNAKLAAITRLVTVETVIVDEASQIEIGDYLPPIHLFHTTLKKLVFIGDNKQLAPHGQDDIKHLKSIFEKPHLREGAVFLDTQYRMPIPIGKFISKHVYSGKLKSVHTIKDKSSCRFVNAEGTEQQQGTSWINLREAQAICKLARTLQNRGESFKVITPYDAQRALLQKLLKMEGLDWENKCFNVDSFQGKVVCLVLLPLSKSLFRQRRGLHHNLCR